VRERCSAAALEPVAALVAEERSRSSTSSGKIAEGAEEWGLAACKPQLQAWPQVMALVGAPLAAGLCTLQLMLVWIVWVCLSYLALAYVTQPRAALCCGVCV
jgi:hypothetical protein